MLRVAIIGCGGIAKVAHLGVYLKLEEESLAKLIAVSDSVPGRIKEKASINIGTSEYTLPDTVHTYTDWREMLRSETIDFVDICLPTFLHAEIAIEVMRMGFHVLSEKPMAITDEDCSAMLKVAEESTRQLMIGQCLRFSGEYAYLKEVIEQNRFGAVKSGVFRRLSSPPAGWGNWQRDASKSGGCITDMHIHDIDMIRYLCGEPESVSCLTQDIYARKDIVHSTLKYPGFSMLAIGDWSLEGEPFLEDYIVAFENATVTYSSHTKTVTVYSRDGAVFQPKIDKNDCYYNEIKFFVELLLKNDENKLNPPESAAKTVKLINTLICSADAGGEYITFGQ